jgi:sugar lactone lactonase YvrE
MKRIVFSAAAIILLSMLLSACGGGSDTSPPSTFSLASSISNLTASGLVLSNGTDTISVVPGANSVTFPTKLLSGTSYNVSIASQPQGFTDICGLNNGAGTVSNSNVTNIAVSCHAAKAMVTTFAGSGVMGSNDGIGTAASFNSPGRLAVDALGNVYVPDSGNNLIRKITPAGIVTTLAGSGAPGNKDGTGTAASFNNPGGVAVDKSGNVYVADSRNNLIRKITPGGVVTTLAGDGSYNSANGMGAAASFAFPTDVSVDAAGNVYVADASNNMIRKVTPTGLVTTYAGSGSPDRPVFGNGPAYAAAFEFPDSVIVDAVGNVYVTDALNNSIREVTAAGIVTSLAGDIYGKSGSADGAGAAATFLAPNAVAVDTSGNVYVVDSGNRLIRKIDARGMVTTIAGNPSNSDIDGIGIAASFRNPAGIALDSAGNIYISDSESHLIRKISAQ